MLPDEVSWSTGVLVVVAFFAVVAAGNVAGMAVGWALCCLWERMTGSKE